jgi:hypothetical protein
MKVKDIPSKAIFVSDTQDVRDIKKHLGKNAYGFNSFFVIVGDGDYDYVWGTWSSAAPYMDDEVIEIVSPHKGE